MLELLGIPISDYQVHISDVESSDDEWLYSKEHAVYIQEKYQYLHSKAHCDYKALTLFSAKKTVKQSAQFCTVLHDTCSTSKQQLRRFCVPEPKIIHEAESSLKTF